MRPSSVPVPIRVRCERSGSRVGPATICMAAALRKYDELDWLWVDDDLGGLNVGDRFWRRIVGLIDRRFFNRLGVRRGHRGDGRVTPGSDLLIVQPRRLSPVAFHRFRRVLVRQRCSRLLDGELGQVSIGVVIGNIARLVFGLRKGVDVRGAFRHRRTLRRRGARFGVFEVENDQAKNHSDKNAELDRNKMCGF